MFNLKQPVGSPPNTTILIVGGPPYDELSKIARNLCSVMNAHLCCTHYVGDLTSLVEYEAMGQYQGELIAIVHGHSHQYLKQDDRKHGLVFFITQPNLGIYGTVSSELATALLDEHVYYLTLQSVRPEVFVIHNTSRSIPDITDKILNHITEQWDIIMRKEQLDQFAENLRLSEVAKESKIFEYLPRIKGSERNTPCHCGCGLKKKKCPNKGIK